MNLPRFLRRREPEPEPVPIGRPRYVLAENITIPAGTEIEPCDALGQGALHVQQDRGCVRVFIGLRHGLNEGMVVTRPALKVVES